MASHGPEHSVCCFHPQVDVNLPDLGEGTQSLVRAGQVQW